MHLHITGSVTLSQIFVRGVRGSSDSLVSNGNGGECFLSKGYYNLTGGEFSKCEISQNLAYVGSHLVLVKKVFANVPNLSRRFEVMTKKRFFK